MDMWPQLEHHLLRHVRENGRDGRWFMLPQTHEDVCASFDPTVWGEGRQAVFIAVDEQGDVRGHSSVTRNELAAHRCSLGMGVEEPSRGVGVGRVLMNAALAWADERFDWVDGQALTCNSVVLALDASVGFELIGLMPDVMRAVGVVRADLAILTRHKR